MNDPLVAMLLLFLLGAVTFNFALILRIAAIVRAVPEPQDLPFTLNLDAPVPQFVGTRLVDGRMVSSETLTGAASVLVFLSSGCGDCKKKVPELVQLLPAMRAAGVRLHVIAMEAEAKVRRFLADTPLLDHVLVLDRDIRIRLNPRNASPFYIFVDDQCVARASHFIGDENWQAFVSQMQEVASEPETACAHD